LSELKRPEHSEQRHSNVEATPVVQMPGRRFFVTADIGWRNEHGGWVWQKNVNGQYRCKGSLLPDLD